MSDDNKFDLTITRAVNGHIVTCKPIPESPLQAASIFLEAQKKQQTEGLEAPDPTRAIGDFLKNMKSMEGSFKAVTMVYRHDEFERMLDDIKSFLSTGIAPASYRPAGDKE